MAETYGTWIPDSDVPLIEHKIDISVDAFEAFKLSDKEAEYLVKSLHDSVKSDLNGFLENMNEDTISTIALHVCDTIIHSPYASQPMKVAYTCVRNVIVA